MKVLFEYILNISKNFSIPKFIVNYSVSTPILKMKGSLK